LKKLFNPKWTKDTSSWSFREHVTTRYDTAWQLWKRSLRLLHWCANNRGFLCPLVRDEL